MVLQHTEKQVIRPPLKLLSNNIYTLFQLTFKSHQISVSLANNKIEQTKKGLKDKLSEVQSLNNLSPFTNENLKTFMSIYLQQTKKTKTFFIKEHNLIFILNFSFLVAYWMIKYKNVIYPYDLSALLLDISKYALYLYLLYGKCQICIASKLVPLLGLKASFINVYQ